MRLRTALAATTASLLAAGLVLTAAPASAAPAARPVDRACPADRVSPTEMADLELSTHRFSVECIVWWGIARGRDQYTYAPAAPVTRGQMATFLAGTFAASGSPLPAASRDWFADDQGSPHETNTNRLREAGVVQGRSDGSYGPNEPVSRAAMASFLVRTVEHRTGEPLPPAPDAFSDDAGNVHEASIDRAAAAGFTGGAADGTYRPAAAVRRDQMGSFLARVLDLLVEQLAVRLPPRPPLPVLELGGNFEGMYGGSMDDAVRWLTARLGPPTSTGSGVLCVGGTDTGRRASWPGLVVQSPDADVETELGTVEGGTLQGWTYLGGPDAPVLRTTEGIGLGSTLAAVRSAYPDSYEGSHAGRSFYEVFYGDTSNLELQLTGLAAGDTVTAMFSGSTCRPPVPQPDHAAAIAYWGDDVMGPSMTGPCSPPDPDGSLSSRWCYSLRERTASGDVYWAVYENAYEPSWEVVVTPYEGGWTVSEVAYAGPE